MFFRKTASHTSIRPFHSSCSIIMVQALLGLGVARDFKPDVQPEPGTSALSLRSGRMISISPTSIAMQRSTLSENGRISTIVATILAVALHSIAFRYNSLMDYLTLLFSLFNAPLFATFLLGMFTTWATPTAGFWGLLAGVVAATTHNIAVRSHVISYGSELLASFYGAVYGFGISLATIALLSMFTRRKSLEDLAGVTYFTCEKDSNVITPGIWILAGCIVAACIALNLIFR